MNNLKVWESRNPNSWFSCVPGINGFLPIKQPLQNCQIYDSN